MKKLNKDGLKPCPFCARQPKFAYFVQSEYGSKKPTKKIVTVICDCGAEAPKDSPSEKSARDKWNRRR